MTRPKSRAEQLIDRYTLAAVFTMGFAFVTALSSTGIGRTAWFGLAIGLAAAGSAAELSLWLRRRHGGVNGAEDREAQPRPGPAGQGTGRQPGTRQQNSQAQAEQADPPRSQAGRSADAQS